MPLFAVTGGAGFIGSHLAEELARRGERVRVVDNFSTGHRVNLAHLDGLELVEADLSDLDAARAAIRGADYVLHQAAIPSVPRSVDDPLTTHRANIDGTLHVLLAAREAGVRRVVYAASSSAYGNAAVSPKHEGLTPDPLSPYALQKLVGEQYGRLFTQLYGLETVSIRYFNVFGPRQDATSHYSGVIAQFITKLLAGERPVVYGDGGQSRDFTYVANVVDGVLRATTAEGAAGKVMNVATGRQVSVSHLFRTVASLVGSDLEPEYRPARAGDVRDSLADISRAREVLGYEPLVPFEEGLRRTVEWYRASRA